MRLYDTARQSIVPFEPRDNRVGLYVCGITPYDAAHLGHAFTYHVFDVITRRLRMQGLEVKSVRNVTDVDDDILRVARERGVGYKTLADEQVALFDADMAALGLLPVDEAPRATDRVAAMAEWVERLVAAGYAYAVDGWVYFDTALFPDYGRLSRLDPEAMVVLARHRGADPDDPRKRHPLDFVLWQPSLPDEPRWHSSWSDGRPGWHIECSVLSSGALGTPIDIHGGGEDLIFPHHESEIAQAEAAGVAPYVRHWVHVAMVNYRGEKMSKSLGNLVFVRDLLSDFAPSTIRLLLASHHFRASWPFEAEELRDADSRRLSYEQALRGGGGLDSHEAAAFESQFLARIDDDLDTPGALRVLDLAAAALSAAARAGERGEVPAAALLAPLLDVLGVEGLAAAASG